MDFLFEIMPKIFPILFIAFFGVMIFVWIRTIRQSLADKRAPRVDKRGIIVAKRTQVTGSQDSTSTSYYVTVEDELGERVELSAKASLYGMVAEGDIGVFTRQGSRLVDFVRDGAADAPAEKEREEEMNGWHRCSGCGATFKGERCDYCGTPWKID